MIDIADCREISPALVAHEVERNEARTRISGGERTRPQPVP